MAVAKQKEQSTAEALQELTDKYVYESISVNPERESLIWDMRENRKASSHKFKPFQNILKESSILWDGSDGKPKGRRLLRYYDGCTTLFADEQSQDKDTIEQYKRSTRDLILNHGEITIYGYDAMLKKYLDMCSWNGESPYRIPTVQAIFVPVNSEKEAMAEMDKLDQLETAIKYAKEAKHSKMVIHAAYLGQSEIDLRTGNKLSEAALRTRYRKLASENPADFIKSFTDNSIEVKYWIEKAVDTGLIDYQTMPNKAVWKKQGTEICDISGLKSRDGVVSKLVEFSQLTEGEEFVTQLKALFN